MKQRVIAADALNQRETEILPRLAAGLSDQQIADDLFLSLNTVKWYNRQIYSKLGVSSRTQAIAWAASHRAPAGSMPPAATPPPSYQLPAQPALFIGRSHEIAEIQHLLRASRLLTLTGAGGIGKTRLALRIATDAVPAFADGACFVDLASLSDHTLVAKAVASALGVLEQPEESLLKTLKRALGPRELLLLVDNYEHVIRAGPVVSELLASAPCLHVLVTSREPLRLAGEQEYLVPPLSVPASEGVSAQQLVTSEAGLLFVRRAQQALPHFEPTDRTAPVIAHICRRLDGLPLAIELAAARSRLFTPQALLDQLTGHRKGSPFRALAGGARNDPPRLRTLRDSITWSYNLLEPDERVLFARLAVFRGGRTLEAIEGVCGDGLSIDPLDGLASLVEKNLIQQQESVAGDPRFVMLEMIHEYARERLRASGEDDVMRQRHAEYFVAWAEAAAPEFRLAGYEHWSRLFAPDLENLRAVLEWSLTGGDVALGARLAGALCLFWYGNGYHVEGQGWTQRLLERLDDVPPVYQPGLLLSAGHMAFLHDLDAGTPLFRRAFDVAQEVGASLQMAWALAFLGYTLLPQPQAAMPILEESLARFRDLHHLPGVAQALNIMGELARFHGDSARARSAYEECLAVCQQTGERRRIVFIFDNLALLAAHDGDFEHTKALARQGLQLAHDMNNRLEVAKALQILAVAIGLLDRPPHAVRLLGAAEQALERMGAFQQLNDKREVDALLATVRAKMDEVTFEAAMVEGRALALERTVAVALDEQDAAATGGDGPGASSS
jgi:predicted ATPase/DNA-binding CsgD family transcriptional regulator